MWGCVGSVSKGPIHVDSFVEVAPEGDMLTLFFPLLTSLLNMMLLSHVS